MSRALHGSVKLGRYRFSRLVQPPMTRAPQEISLPFSLPLVHSLKSDDIDERTLTRSSRARPASRLFSLHRPSSRY